MTGSDAMRVSIKRALCALAFLLPLAGGAAAESVDPSRIVTVGGSVTEIVYALGLGANIVGVDSTSVYPPEALRNAPDVGYMRALSAEGVLSLNPSAILAIEGAGPPATLKQLMDAGAPLVSVRDQPTPEGASDKIVAIGALLGASERAQALAQKVRARFAALEAMLPRTAKRPRVLFVLSLQNGRVMAGGRDTAAVNAAEGFAGFKPMTDEGVIAAAPDAILKMTNGSMVGGADELFALPAFASTPAAARRALIGMDGPYLLGFGPREPDALRELMALLYPDVQLPALP
jgi:iron complex transport system substrate-binding protein